MFIYHTQGITMEVTIVRCDNETVIVQVSDGGVPFTALTVHRKEDPNKFEMVMRYDRDSVDSSANQPTSLDELMK